MNNPLILYAWLGGIFSGSFLLLIGAILPQSILTNPSSQTIFFTTLVEEIVKFIFILSLVKIAIKNYFSFKNILLILLAFSIGFSILESTLIIISLPSINYYPAIIQPIILHLTTTLLTGVGGWLIFKKKYVFFTLGTLLLFLSLMLHLIYNFNQLIS